jgi:hypothetical protein
MIPRPKGGKPTEQSVFVTLAGDNAGVKEKSFHLPRMYGSVFL